MAVPQPIDLPLPVMDTGTSRAITPAMRIAAPAITIRRRAVIVSCLVSPRIAGMPPERLRDCPPECSPNRPKPEQEKRRDGSEAHEVVPVDRPSEPRLMDEAVLPAAESDGVRHRSATGEHDGSPGERSRNGGQPYRVVCDHALKHQRGEQDHHH